MNTPKTALCCIVLITLSGCSAFRPNKQLVKFNCNVQGTILKINGDTHICPGEYEIRRDSKVSVEAYKEGYDKYNKTIDYHLSTYGKLDIIGTPFTFFTAFGLMYPGAFDLDETDISIVLNKLDYINNNAKQ